MPLECPHIRSIARCVFPVLVGPRTATTGWEAKRDMRIKIGPLCYERKGAIPQLSQADSTHGL